MLIVQRTKKGIVQFLAARKRRPVRIEASDGPFRYEYVSISHVVGAKLPNDSEDPLQIGSFPETNARAYLTHNWDDQYIHIDRSNSVATLLLTALVGDKRFTKLSRYANRILQWVFGAEWVFIRNLETQAARIKKNRHDDQPPSGCCLVYRAQGQVDQSVNFGRTWRFGEVAIALDAADISVIRNEHETSLRNVATAVSLAMTDTTGSPEIRFLADHVHLLTKDEVVIYVRTAKVGSTGLVITTVPSNEFVAAIQSYAAALSANSKLASMASLFTLSQHTSNDNLRSFIAAWAALEFLINHLEKKHRDDFHELLNSDQVTLPVWDKDLKSVDIKDYRLRDRFYVVACTLNLTEAEADTKKFNQLNITRNKYYHDLKIDDSELHTHHVQSLFRKYLKIVLSV